MKKQIAFVLVLVFVLLSLGCALLQKNLTAEERYLAARTWMNNNVETYLEHFKAADEATKAEWRVKIHPILDAAFDALDAWGNAKGDGSKEDKWITLKRELVARLLEAGILKIKEGE